MMMIVMKKKLFTRVSLLTFYLIAFLCVIQWNSLVRPVSGHWCGHDQLAKEIPLVTAPQQYSRTTTTTTKEGVSYDLLKEEEIAQLYAPIRILFHTESLLTDPLVCKEVGDVVNGVTCTSAHLLNQAKRNTLNQLSQITAQRSSELLSVIPIQGNLRFGQSSTTCGSATVPSIFRTTGVSHTDLVVFVIAVPRQAGARDVASAGACLVDSNRRAVAGVINVNPILFFNSGDSLTQDKINVFIHEVFHVFGFSSSRMQEFRDRNGVPLGLSNVIRSVTRTHRSHSNTVNMVITENVKQRFQRHIECNHVEGVDLENQGGSGTANSHWEMKLFYGEIMMGYSAYENPGNSFAAISDITLALFEDSGWYKANFSAADYFLWGKRMGCSFTGRCENWDNPERLEGYFCSNDGEDGCTYNHIHKGYCHIGVYSSDLGYFATLPNPRHGGYFDLMNYCPMYMGYEDCRQIQNFKTTAYGEQFGQHSRCFKGTAIRENISAAPERIRCYETRCVDGILNVKVGSHWYVCPPNGGTLSNLNGFTGSIDCPKSFVICKSLDRLTEANLKFKGTGTFGLGSNSLGQIGVNVNLQTVDRLTVIENLLEKKVSLIAAGRDFTYVHTQNPKTLYAFGNNQYGALGLAQDTNNPSHPVIVEGFNGLDIVSLCAGDKHGIAVLSSGSVRVMGDNAHGQIGLGSSVANAFSATTLPASLFGGEKVLECSCGGLHSICVTETRKVFVFGSNSVGQLGLNISTTTTTSVQYNPLHLISLDYENITKVAAGRFSSYAVNIQGDVFSWGRNIHGELGIGSSQPFVSIPSIVPLSLDIKKIIPCDNHVLAITIDDRLFGFGEGLKLSGMSPSNYRIPSLINVNNTGISHAACGLNFSMVIGQDDHVYLWGDSASMSLNRVYTPTSVAYLYTITQGLRNVEYGHYNATIAAGREHAVLYLSLNVHDTQDVDPSSSPSPGPPSPGPSPGPSPPWWRVSNAPPMQYHSSRSSIIFVFIFIAMVTHLFI